MSSILFIKATNRHRDESVTVKLYETFLESFTAAHRSAQMKELHLFDAALPYMDKELANGLTKQAQGKSITNAERAALTTADYYLEQFLSADKIVIAFPLWNMTIPAVLHTYFDYLNREGKTYRYDRETNSFTGLLREKKVVLLNARGGYYSDGPMAKYEMAVSYVTNMLTLYGVKQLESIIIEGHHSFLGEPKDEQQAAQIIQQGLQQAAAYAKQF